MSVVAHHLRKVLVKGASKADVEQLHATANGKQGQLSFERIGAQRHFPPSRPSR